MIKLVQGYGEAGVFRINNGMLSAPKDFMKDKGDILLAAMLDGKEPMFSMLVVRAPSIEMAVCYYLQQVYCTWLANKQMNKVNVQRLPN